jgi:hypothetical protein
MSRSPDLPPEAATLRPVGVAVRHVFPVWLASRAAVALISLAGAHLVAAGNENTVAGFGTLSNRWDVQLFVKVARYGYLSPAYPDRTEVDFPGMPLLLRAVHLVVRNWVAAGLIISLVASFAACVALWLLAERSDVGDRAVLALLLFPYTVFLFAGYSEALFLACAAWAWWALREDRLVLAALLGAGATATRVLGIPFAAALIVEYVVRRRREGRPIRLEAAWLLAPLLPLLGFVGYLRARTGHWDAYARAMREGWHRDLAAPWTAIRTTWHSAFDLHQPAAFVWFWRAELLAVVVGVVVTVVLVRGRRWGEATFVGGSTLLMSCATYLASGVRAVLVWFPLYLLLGRVLARRPWAQTAYLWLSGALAAVFVVAFTSGQWVD